VVTTGKGMAASETEKREIVVMMDATHHKRAPAALPASQVSYLDWSPLGRASLLLYLLALVLGFIGYAICQAVLVCCAVEWWMRRRERQPGIATATA
jgi:hypothetical protein